eukprot:Nk52_evm31s230 gene=Nk52_evmTU31s230
MKLLCASLSVLLIVTHFSALAVPITENSSSGGFGGETINAATENIVSTTATYRFSVDPNGFPVSPVNLGFGILDVIAVSPGLLGTAFDTSTIEAVDIPNPQSIETTSIITNEHDKEASIGASASVTGTGYGATVSAQASYLNEIKTSSSSAHYMLSFQQIVKETELNLATVQLTEQAIQLLNSDPQAFVNRWGRYFISSYTTGCNVYAYSSLVTSSQSDMATLNVELQQSYASGVFSAEGSQSFDNAVSSSSISSTLSGQATVIGVAAPSNISPNNPASIFEYKQYVAEECKTGSIVSATLSSFLSVPSVLNAIQNDDAIRVLSANTLQTPHVTQYWEIVLQLQTIANDANQCSRDINRCLTEEFLYDEETAQSTMNEFFVEVTTVYNEFLALRAEEIAANLLLLPEYQIKTTGYSDQYTSFTQSLAPINFESVKATASGIDTVNYLTRTLLVSQGMEGVENIYENTNTRMVVYFRMHYGVDSITGQTYIVLRANCLNGASTMSCYTMEDVQSASFSTIVLDASVCGANAKLSAKIGSPVPPNSRANGNAFGRQCPAEIETKITDTFPDAPSSVFCSWSSSYAPFYVDGTAPTCNGSCGRNWNCGRTKSGNACWTGSKRRCVRKHDLDRV